MQSMLEELDGFDLQRLGKAFQGVDSRSIFLSLDHADVIAIETGQVGELLLCEPAFLAQSLEISRHDSPESHGLQRSPSPSHPPPSILGFFARAP